jgi:hypothetical protein
LDTVQEAGRAPHGLTCLLGALIRPGTVSRNITHSLSSHGQCLGPPISGVWLGIRASGRAECSGCRLEPPSGNPPARRADSEPRICMPSAYGSNKNSGMDGGVQPHNLLKPSRAVSASARTHVELVTYQNSRNPQPFLGLRPISEVHAFPSSSLHSAANACASYAGPCMRLEALQFSFQSHNTLNPSTYAL